MLPRVPASQYLCRRTFFLELTVNPRAPSADLNMFYEHVVPNGTKSRFHLTARLLIVRRLLAPARRCILHPLIEPIDSFSQNVQQGFPARIAVRFER